MADSPKSNSTSKTSNSTSNYDKTEAELWLRHSRIESLYRRIARTNLAALPRNCRLNTFQRVQHRGRIQAPDVHFPSPSELLVGMTREPRSYLDSISPVYSR